MLAVQRLLHPQAEQPHGKCNPVYVLYIPRVFSISNANTAYRFSKLLIDKRNFACFLAVKQTVEIDIKET